MAELFNILPTPSYQKGLIAEGEKGCHHEDHQKDVYNNSQINDIERLFRKLVGNDVADRILAEMRTWQRLAAGQSATSLDDPLSRSVMGGIRASIENTLKKAKQRWESMFRSRGPNWALENPLNPALIDIRPEMEWIQVLNSEGYTLIADKISKQFLPDIMRIVNEGLVRENPLSWSEIATQLKQQIGIKGRYHWERIVRTEMAKAIEAANDRQAKAMGVPFQKWSASVLSNNICDQCAALNGNIYPTGEAPARPVHPNCRCTLIPTWEKPKVN